MRDIICSSPKIALYKIHKEWAKHFMPCSNFDNNHFIYFARLLLNLEFSPFLLHYTDPWWWKTFTAECSSRQKGHLLYFPAETAKQEIWITKSQFHIFSLSQKDHNCFCYISWRNSKTSNVNNTNAFHMAFPKKWLLSLYFLAKRQKKSYE